MSNLNKRNILDFKRELSLIAHDFNFECKFLNKYLDDSKQMLRKALYLPEDATIHSIEFIDYSWSVQHDFYFSCSFITMLMQISENLTGQVFNLTNEYFGEGYKFKKHRVSYYESIDIELMRMFNLKIDSKKWTDLSHLYQIRNIIVHDNNTVDIAKATFLPAFITKYKGIKLYDDQMRIVISFCYEALTIFKRGLADFFKEIGKTVNEIKNSTPAINGKSAELISSENLSKLVIISR